jgi:hypothetical protein
MEVSGQIYSPSALSSGQEHPYVLNKCLCWSHGRSGYFGKDKNLFVPPKIETRFLVRPTQNLVTYYYLFVLEVTLSRQCKSVHEILFVNDVITASSNKDN